MTRKKGFTLVEVLVAMSVGTFVLGIAYTLMLMSGVQAKETELDVTARQDIRLLQEMLMYDLQYLEVFDVYEDSGNTMIETIDGSILVYAYDPAARSISRIGADGMTRTFLAGNAGPVSVEMTSVSGGPLMFDVEFTSDGSSYSLDITNRIRSGVRGFGYQIPPSVIADPNYLLYIDLENGKFARLKDESGAVITEPVVMEMVPDRIEVVQSSSRSLVQVNLYSGASLITSFVYSESLVQFNGKGSADTVPMVYIEGMVRDTYLDLRIENKRNLSGANASVSFGYRYLNETVPVIEEIKFKNSYFDIY